MLKPIVLFACAAALSGCASFAKGVTEAILDPNDDEERQCRIEGAPFHGINELHEAASAKGTDGVKTLRMLIVHGIGEHPENYSEPFVANIARGLGMTTRAREQKRVRLSEAVDTPVGTLSGQELGTLVITRYTNPVETRELLAFEVNWSGYHSIERNAFVEADKDVAKLRASINETVKTFFNRQVVDPVKYIGDTARDIRAHVRQASCWMVSADWDEFPSERRGADGDLHVCYTAADDAGHRQTRRNFQQIITEDQFVAITHSLGSRIFLDAFSIPDDDPNSIVQNVFTRMRDGFSDEKATVFMLSNQLPLLQLGFDSRGLNGVLSDGDSSTSGNTRSIYIPWRNSDRYTGQLDPMRFPEATSKDDLCLGGDNERWKRRFEELSIVTINDPNDLLSYKLTEDFKRDYIDWALCPKFTDVTIEVAATRDVFGLNFANPGEAHGNYWTDEGLAQLLIEGFGNPDLADQSSQKSDRTYEVDDRGRTIVYECDGTFYKDGAAALHEASAS